MVSRGGDADTNACVAGALLGAKLGKSRIPDRWLSKLRAAPELTSLGEQLYRQLHIPSALRFQWAWVSQVVRVVAGSPVSTKNT